MICSLGARAPRAAGHPRREKSPTPERPKVPPRSPATFRPHGLGDVRRQGVDLALLEFQTRSGTLEERVRRRRMPAARLRRLGHSVSRFCKFALGSGRNSSIKCRRCFSVARFQARGRRIHPLRPAGRGYPARSSCHLHRPVQPHLAALVCVLKVDKSKLPQRRPR